MNNQLTQELLNQYGNFDFIWTALTQSEEQFIIGLQQWFAELKANNLWRIKINDDWQQLDDVMISSVYPIEKQTNFQITVEAHTPLLEGEGFSKNMHPMFYNDKEYIEFGALIKFNMEIKCFALTRVSVSKLADAVCTGLMTKIFNYLASCGITISANSINLAQRITRTQLLDKNSSSYEITISVSNIIVEWIMILEQNGDLLKQINIIAQK